MERIDTHELASCRADYNVAWGLIRHVYDHVIEGDQKLWTHPDFGVVASAPANKPSESVTIYLARNDDGTYRLAGRDVAEFNVVFEGEDASWLDVELRRPRPHAGS
jgi:hypothetical protein